MNFKVIRTMLPLAALSLIVTCLVFDTAEAKAIRWAPTDSFKKITKAPSHSDESEVTSEESADGIVVTSEPAPGTTALDGKSNGDDDDFSVVLKPISKPTQKTAETQQVQSKVVSAEKALQWLSNGNIRYTKKRFRADGRGANDRKRLINSQAPHAIVLADMDSRVPPEIIFDQMLGGILVIRVAGPSIDSSIIASIETALKPDNAPKLLVILGHTNSELISRALDYTETDGDKNGLENRLLAEIKARLKTVESEKRSLDLSIEAVVNADGIGRELAKRSDSVKNKLESQDLVIKPALYRLDSGKVTFY